MCLFCSDKCCTFVISRDQQFLPLSCHLQIPVHGSRRPGKVWTESLANRGTHFSRCSLALYWCEETPNRGLELASIVRLKSLPASNRLASSPEKWALSIVISFCLLLGCSARNLYNKVGHSVRVEQLLGRNGRAHWGK